MYYRFLSIFAFTFSLFICAPIQAQLRIGTANTKVNFRVGPGTNYKILQTINASHLLVILPLEPKNGFVDVFDVETSSRGYVHESLIKITGMLTFGKQHFFEKSGENATGDVQIELINGTTLPLFVWINKSSYDISPHEKKILVLDDEEIMYFSSEPGLFPVFGRETLQKGSTYTWKFSK